MTRSRAWLALTIVAVAMMQAQVAVAAPESINVRRVEVDSFPEISVLMSMDSSEPLSDKDVTVMEDGEVVDRLEIRPLDEEVVSVDIVLVMDTSGSMVGEPMSAAIAAAEAFVNELPPDIRVGLVSFSDQPRILKRISNERSSLLAELGSLEASGETALYDAVSEASGLFSGSGQRNIVLLSDGGDTASRTSLRSAASTNASVFAVGLKSGEFDERALKYLARSTDGQYSPVASANLGRLYEGLATELSNQYVLTYESNEVAGGEATISVDAFGLTDSILTLLPPLPSDAGAARARPEPEAPSQPLIRDVWGLALVLGMFFLACLWIVSMVLGSRYRDERDHELARLMAIGGRERSGEARLRPRQTFRWIPSLLVRLAQRFTDRRGLGVALDLRIERAGLPLSPEEFLAMTIVASVTGTVVGFVLLGNVLGALAIACAAALVPNFVLALLARRRFNRLHGQLPDILMILASSIRSGHSFLQALDMVSKETGEPGGTEFARLVAEIRLGRPMNEAMSVMSDRIGSDDFRWAVLAVNIQREVGGNLAELLDGVAETLRDRETLRRQVDVLSSEGRISIGILTVLPIIVTLYMSQVNPDYIGLLFNTGVGVLLLGAASVLLVTGYFWMRRIVKIDV
ncbi:MAG: type II secretion system F family protein [Actinomycetota bacterium]